MILKDGTAIALSEVNFPLHIVLSRATRQDVIVVWDELTPENLERVEFRENDDVLFAFLNCHVNGEQIIVNADGSITGHYYLTGDREVAGPSEYEEAARILLGEEE